MQKSNMKLSSIKKNHQNSVNQQGRISKANSIEISQKGIEQNSKNGSRPDQAFEIKAEAQTFLKPQKNIRIKNRSRVMSHLGEQPSNLSEKVEQNPKQQNSKGSFEITKRIVKKWLQMYCRDLEMRKYFKKINGNISIAYDHFFTILMHVSCLLSCEINAEDLEKAFAHGLTFQKLLDLQSQSEKPLLQRLAIISKVVNMHLISQVQKQRLRFSEQMQKNLKMQQSAIQKTIQCEKKYEELNGVLKQHRKMLQGLICEEKQNQISIFKQKEQLKNLVQDISVHKKSLADLDSQRNNIENYVNNQSNQMIRAAAERFKKTEQDICSFAGYLQFNKLATDESYLPESVEIIEDNIKEEMKTLNKQLIQSGKPLEEKNALMQNFVLMACQKYEVVSDHLKKLLVEKTRFIGSFIDLMLKWYQNWECKQDLLSNLRKEFSIVIGRANGNMNNMFGKCKHVCSNCMVDLPELRKNIERMEKNYKLGNTFY